MHAESSSDDLEAHVVSVQRVDSDPAQNDARSTSTRRGARKSSGTKRSRSDHAQDAAADAARERLRLQAAEAIAATRARIVENPLQAIAIAAAGGALLALLFGPGRR